MKPAKRGYLQAPQRSRIQIEHDLDLALAKQFVQVDADFLDLYKKRILQRSDRVLKSELKELVLYLGLQAVSDKSFKEIHQLIKDMKFGSLAAK